MALNNLCERLDVVTPRKPLKEIERSLQTTYRKEIWAKFIRAIKTYNLIEENDCIAVAISGGKDSIILAKLMMQLQKYSDIPFTVKYISMNPGFKMDNLKQMEENCRYLEIPVVIKESDVFKVAERLASDNPCYMCARMRRGFLYKLAQDEGCNKLALGHHFDDVIETTLLNIFYGSQYKTMVPKIKAENFENMELIRPLVLIKEADIIRFTKSSGIQTMNCGCTVAAKRFGSKRAVVKKLIEDLKKDNPNVDYSIFKSATNINLNQVYGYQLDEKIVEFNDIYEGRRKDVQDV